MRAAHLRKARWPTGIGFQPIIGGTPMRLEEIATGLRGRLALYFFCGENSIS
jgi:hypothetical protein